jgi:hypothetical protein
MKKQNRKLRLGKETLLGMQQSALRPVLGASVDGIVSCACSTPKGCDTLNTCTTHLC